MKFFVWQAQAQNPGRYRRRQPGRIGIVLVTTASRRMAAHSTMFGRPPVPEPRPPIGRRRGAASVILIRSAPCRGHWRDANTCQTGRLICRRGLRNNNFRHGPRADAVVLRVDQVANALAIESRPWLASTCWGAISGPLVRNRRRSKPAYSAMGRRRAFGHAWLPGLDPNRRPSD